MINNIFKPTYLDLVSEINTKLCAAIMIDTSVTLSSASLPTVSSLGLNNTLPTLYCFEIDSLGKHSNASLVSDFYAYRVATKKSKAITAVHHPMLSALTGSKCLYVGKVRSGINARLSIHFGTGGSSQTAGLRLIDWLPKGITLTLQIYQITKLIDTHLVDMFEEYLRRMRNPILGIK